MDLNALIWFVEIVDSSSLSSAARKLKVSRSAVSHRLKVLETSLGVQLLRRTTRRIDPTEIGIHLYEHGRAIINEVSAARTAVLSLGTTPRGSVRLSVPTGLGQAVLSPLLIDYKRQNPAVTLEVVFENRIFNLLEDEVDIAIRIISKPPDPLIATDLGAVDWLACGTPAYLEANPAPRTLKDFTHSNIVCSAAMGKKLTIRARRNQERHEIVVNPILRSENFQFLKDAVLAGSGLGMLPYYQVKHEIDQRSLVPVLTEYQFSVFGTKAFMLSVANRYQTMAIRSLTAFLKLHVREKLAALNQEFAALKPTLARRERVGR